MKNNTKKFIINLLLLFVFTALLPTNFIQAASKSKNVYVPSAPTKSVKQGSSNWCWAASISNINKILKGNYIPLDKVVEYGKTTNLKKPITNTPRSVGGSINDIKRAFNRLNITYTRKQSSLSFNEIMKEINAGRPIYVAKKTHALTIVGYNKSDETVMYLDSNYSNRLVLSYKEFKSSKFYGSWDNTFYNLRSK